MMPFTRRVGIPSTRSAGAHSAPGFRPRGHANFWNTLLRANAAPDQDLAMRKNPDLYAVATDGRPSAAAAPSTARGRKKPEILAPVGGWDQLRAAVENGADCVYFGVTDFNARQRASNFDAKTELHEVMRYLRERGVRGYCTLNVLVYDAELPALEETVRWIAQAGVHAVIVQDLGVCEVVRRVAPHLPIHGSTQMSITSGEGAEFARKAAGVKRVVVGRELSIKEIERTVAGTTAEVETFVHGALCVSYSGQCFSSEAWGGRSANRGRCAQACRVPYGLIVNGRLRDLGDLKYLLSPQDLMAVDQVPALVRAGVECFKIEGRLKGPEYVALTTAVYRQAVDAAWAAVLAEQRPIAMSIESAAEKSSSTAVPKEDFVHRTSFTMDEATLRSLQQVFARGQDGTFRGLTPGFLEGSQHQRLVRGRNPRHRGVFAGTVVDIAKSGGVVIDAEIPIRRGDGLVFDAGTPQDREAGGMVFDVLDARSGRRREDAAPELGGAQGRVTLVLGAGAIAPGDVRKGDLVWRNKDPILEAKIRRTFEGLAESEKRAVPVDCHVSGALGAPLVVTLTDAKGRAAQAATSEPLQPASKRPLDAAAVADAIGNLGGTTLRLRTLDLGGLDLAAPGGVFIPASLIKVARRAAAEQLAALQLAHGVAEDLREEPVVQELMHSVRTAADPQPLRESESDADGVSQASTSAPTTPRLRVLCRSAAQVTAACALDFVSEIILDFLEVHGLKESAEEVKAAGKRVVIASPRIIKPGEERLLMFYLRLGANALLVRSAGLLHQLLALGGPGAVFQGMTVPRLEGDFSLNASNVLSADVFLRAGLDLLTPTHDLNAKQVCQLASGLGPRAAKLEMILHQHLPIFHTEHCVFCRTLSDGNSYLDCGHPCETNTVHLRDEKGRDNLVLADAGCRNTVFNAEAQSGLPYLRDFVAAGVRSFRVELVDEPAACVAPLLTGYRDALASGGKGAWKDFWSYLGTLPDANGRVMGVGLGSLIVGEEQAKEAMKQTAYQARAAAQNGGAAVPARGKAQAQAQGRDRRESEGDRGRSDVRPQRKRSAGTGRGAGAGARQRTDDHRRAK